MQTYQRKINRFVACIVLTIAVTGNPVGQISLRYTYDSLNRVVEVRHTDKIFRYAYDDAGNRISLSIELLLVGPAIIALNPRGAVAGSGISVLKIFGANFSPDSVVNWNGTSRPTTFISANEVRINIDPADIATAGTASVVVTNPTPSIVVSNAQTFSVVPTAALSGQVTAGGNPLPNVTINLAGAETDSVVTDSNGTFNFAVLNNGSYAISPMRVNYSFDPVSRNVNYSGVSQSNLNFAGSLVNYPISGRIATATNVGVPGITVALSGSHTAQTTTDANGNYTINATAEGSYTVTPNLLNYSFTPPNQVFANLNSAQTANFTATPTVTLQDAQFDFDGDRKTDVGIFRPPVAEWWYLRSSDGGNRAFQFGAPSDKLAPGDFTGDGKTDIAFFRPSTGFWFVLRSEDSSFFSFPFGTNGDIPVPADYDGDGKTDPTVFRPSTSTWFIQRSSDNGTTIAQFGATGDLPVVGDYDGDAKADLAIFRPGPGEWWYLRSSDGGNRAFQFGSTTDKVVPGDYTGDGKTDIAFWRPSTGFWFVLRSENLSFFSFPFGASGDVVVPGDYDGDGKQDPAIFRPSEANWYIQRSTAGTQILQFGVGSDRPIPNAFVH